MHARFVSNLYMLAANGCIIATCLNILGSIHDSTLAQWRGIYEKLEATNKGTGGICCVDSVFALNPHPHLIQTTQDITIAKTPQEYNHLVEAILLWQASGWGMHAIVPHWSIDGDFIMNK